MGRKVGLVFIRLLMFIYINQRCFVKWREIRSYSFEVKNGTRQGSVFSPKGGFGVYLDPLLQLLRESGHGLMNGLHWYGALAYCDDLILLATSVASLQQMVNICSQHAAANDLLFSTHVDPMKSKTVCIAFHCKNKEQLPKILLNNDPLPWKTSSKHIGCLLNEDGTMDSDVKVKRAIFVNDCMSINNEFCFLKPEHQVKLVKLYCSHFSGSSAWSFNSVHFKQLMNSWNVNVKVAYELPYATHSFLAEEITGGNNARQMVYKRFIKFLSSIANNRRQALVSLLNSVKTTCRSLTGGNLRILLLETDVLVVPGVTRGHVLTDYRVYKTPEGQEWKVPLLVSLLQIRDDTWSVNFDEETGQFSDDEITELINNVCIS